MERTTIHEKNIAKYSWKKDVNIVCTFKTESIQELTQKQKQKIYTRPMLTKTRYQLWNGIKPTFYIYINLVPMFYLKH